MQTVRRYNLEHDHGGSHCWSIESTSQQSRSDRSPASWLMAERSPHPIRFRRRDARNCQVAMANPVVPPKLTRWEVARPRHCHATIPDHHCPTSVAQSDSHPKLHCRTKSRPSSRAGQQQGARTATRKRKRSSWACAAGSAVCPSHGSEDGGACCSDCPGRSTERTQAARASCTSRASCRRTSCTTSDRLLLRQSASSRFTLVRDTDQQTASANPRSFCWTRTCPES